MTFYGKIIATGLCVIGVAFWTLPGGIIGSGFAFKIEQRNKIKKFNRLVPAAAYLIQTWWRMKVLMDVPTHNTTRLVSVLKVFETKNTNDENNNNNVKTKSSNKKSQHYNYFEKIDSNIDNIDSKNEENVEEREIFLREERQKEQDSENYDFLFRKLRPQTIVMIRSILLLKFFVAKNKFKFAHKPYDFKDVIEQYTKGNMDILIKIKELQRKLDQSSNSSNQMHSRASFHVSPTSRKKNTFHRQFSFHDSLSTQHERSSIISLENRIESIELKLDQLIVLQTSRINNENSYSPSNVRNIDE